MSNEHIALADGTTLVLGSPADLARVLIRAADLADGASQGDVLYSPIRGGYVVPQVIADSLATAEQQLADEAAAAEQEQADADAEAEAAKPKRSRRAAAEEPVEAPVDETPAATPAADTPAE